MRRTLTLSAAVACTVALLPPLLHAQVPCDCASPTACSADPGCSGLSTGLSPAEPLAPRVLFDPETSLPRTGAPLDTAPDLLAAWQRLREAYAAVSSVHLRARARVLRRPSAEAEEFLAGSAESRLEYWQQGERYRLRVTTDPNLDLVQDTEVAYDGRYHQILWPAQSLLLYRTGDRGAAFVALPNPFFLPLAFLAPDPRLCRVCSLLLEDAHDGRLWQHRRGASGVLRAGGAPKVSVTGWRASDGLTRFLLTLNSDRGAWPLARIERQEPGERSVLEFAKVRPARSGGFLFPHEIHVRTYAEGQELPLDMLTIVVEELEINRPVAGSVFSIPFDAARRVLDEDRGKYVKYECTSSDPAALCGERSGL